jgi:CRP/FNR family transcriptional regulator
VIRRSVPAGQIFIHECDPAEQFFNVTAGTVRLVKALADGRRQVTGFARAGHFLGPAVSDRYGFAAEAIESVRLCPFSRPRLHRLIEDFPVLERQLLDTASNELVAAQGQMLLLGRKTARGRMASFLIAQLAPSSPCQPPRLRLHPPMTRGDMVDYLGLTIETVSRTFSRLRADPLITLPTPAIFAFSAASIFRLVFSIVRSVYHDRTASGSS